MKIKIVLESSRVKVIMILEERISIDIRKYKTKIEQNCWFWDAPTDPLGVPYNSSYKWL